MLLRFWLGEKNGIPPIKAHFNTPYYQATNQLTRLKNGH